MTKAETLKQKKSDSITPENFDGDFTKDLSINKYKLDEECLSHSSRYAFYAEACAVSKTNVSKANDQLKLVTAEANLRIRKQYAEEKVKFTEAVIASELEVDKKVLEAKELLRDAEETYARLQVAVQAMDARRSELDNLVKLYCAGYYSVSKSDDIKKTINDQTSSDIRKELNK